MTDHVDSHLDMFAESCDQVKKKLEKICVEVKNAIADKSEEVFSKMSRDCKACFPLTSFMSSQFFSSFKSICSAV